MLDGVGEADPWEWRTTWYRGVGCAQPRATALPRRRVRQRLPHAPRRAGAEAGARPRPRGRSVIMRRPPGGTRSSSRTEPSFTAATFGLARCRLAMADRAGAIDAYSRVPDTSSAHADALIAQAELLLDMTRHRRDARPDPRGNADRTGPSRSRAAGPAPRSGPRAGVGVGSRRRFAAVGHRQRARPPAARDRPAPGLESDVPSARPQGRGPRTSGSPSSIAPTGSARGRGGDRGPSR